MRKQCRQLQTVIWKLVIGGLTSVILVILGTVNLQFQGLFVPISLRPVLRIVAAHVLGSVWSHVVNFTCCSVSVRQLTGCGSEYYL